MDSTIAVVTGVFGEVCDEVEKSKNHRLFKNDDKTFIIRDESNAGFTIELHSDDANLTLNSAYLSVESNGKGETSVVVYKDNLQYTINRTWFTEDE